VRMGEAARNHKRYMFYFERFKNHADSIKKERANRWGWLGQGGSEGLRGGAECRCMRSAVLPDIEGARTLRNHTPSLCPSP
jgi:hypothetical protein